MLNQHVCPKCRHNHILVIAAIPDKEEYGFAELHIAKVVTGEGWLGPKYGIAGRLTAALCRKCGYTELYATRPDEIPVDGEWVREVVGPEPEGPYR
jgi:hypothetical protein